MQWPINFTSSRNLLGVSTTSIRDGHMDFYSFSLKVSFEVVLSEVHMAKLLWL